MMRERRGQRNPRANREEAAVEVVSRERKRARRRQREEPIDPQLDYAGYVAAPIVDPASAAADRQLCRAARALLPELAPGIRDVVLLSLFRELSDQEVADTLAIPLGTVKSRKSRGLSHLRSRLDNVNERNPP